MSCYCDSPPAEFCSERTIKSRLQFRCYECGGFVLPGEQYEYMAGKWEGNLCTAKTCMRCRDMRVWVRNNIPCLCWEYGNVDECLKEAVDDAVYRAPKETVGLRFGLLRRKYLRDQFNQKRRKEMGLHA